ncbi:TlyA family RNA methyltransferase [Aquabacter sp. L1I39]|uniref:TlyA family RNA methyltransferase n=1 Tax=Aquabacter sp. L1I39 TaxID=2820278 RepID=UPI001FFCFA1E|nr:TlyA family RNA methyltransferase [Aquabacter sp. L1I39]
MAKRAGLAGMGRERIDKLLVARGLFDSRARAQAAILAGGVSVAGRVVDKPSDMVDADAAIEATDLHPYVSRGGLKLAAALDTFGINPEGGVALDLGASTGGFTDVLLRRGARRVYAVDVGHDQFHPRLRARPEVRLLEGTDARSLGPDLIPEPVDLVVADVSFISLALVLPPALPLAGPGAQMAVLVKPQFEAGPAHVKKGIVRDPAVHEEVCARIQGLIESQGWRVRGLVPSPIAGGDGNREFLLGAERPF